MKNLDKILEFKNKNFLNETQKKREEIKLLFPDLKIQKNNNFAQNLQVSQNYVKTENSRNSLNSIKYENSRSSLSSQNSIKTVISQNLRNSQNSIKTQNSQSSQNILNEIKSDPAKKKIYDASLDFQSIFIEKMLSSMRKNLNPENDLLYGGSKQKIFEDMLYQEYSNMLSHTDHFNMALDIYKQVAPKVKPIK